MEEEISKSIIGLIVTIIVGGVIKLFFDYKTAVMQNIWEKRLEAYMKFCKATDLFPLYPSRIKEATWKDIYTTSIQLKDWYFEGYGLLLHTRLRASYFETQRYLNERIEGRENSGEMIGDEKYEEVRRKCSALRTDMINSLELRKDPILPKFIKHEWSQVK